MTRTNQSGNQGASHSSRQSTPRSTAIRDEADHERVPSMIARDRCTERSGFGSETRWSHGNGPRRSVASPDGTTSNRNAVPAARLAEREAAELALPAGVGAAGLQQVVAAEVGPERAR